MRTSMAYFAGVGTVVAAVAVGLGGGLLISNVVSPHEPKIEMSKLEQRMSSKPIAVTNTTSEPTAYLAATAPASSGPITVPTPVQNKQPTEPADSTPTQAQAAADVTPAASPPQTAAPVTQAATSEKTSSDQAREQVRPPEAAFARVRDSDLKARDADVRREARRAEDKRKAERRQQWTERRRPRQDQELRDVEQKVREETEQPRAFAVEPVRLEGPRIQLFGND
jgi:type IV secretory pathway VirB10-like protein